MKITQPSQAMGYHKQIKRIKCNLKRPVCAEKGAKVTMGRSIGQRWRLIGYGIIK